MNTHRFTSGFFQTTPMRYLYFCACGASWTWSLPFGRLELTHGWPGSA